MDDEDLLEEAERYISEKNYEKAIRVLEGIELPEAYALRANCYYSINQKDKAIEELKTGLKKFPFNHYFYYLLSLIYFNDKNYEEALKEIENALAIIPYSFEYNKLKGKILFEIGDYENAYNVFAYVNKLKPDDIETRLFKAECFYRIGRYLDALAEINRGLSYDNKNPLLHFLKGKVYLETGYYRLAISEFKIVLSLKASAEAYYYLAVAEYLNKEYKNALDHINEALKERPNDERFKELYSLLKNMNT
ncbi:MAG: tetratricopeptide repeat protein [Saccharolobus sp.]